MLTETCIINGKNYGFSCTIRDNAVLRRGFNDLAELVYGFSFERWYANRYWGDSYVPYVLTAGDKVVANVSVNLMDFRFEGIPRRYIQIGTVMTHPQYRWQGLSRWLMERVLHDWRSACEGMYLYANDTVLEYYPKFGFVQALEYKHTCPAPKPDVLIQTRKLNMDLLPDRQLLDARCRNCNPHAVLTMENNPGLVMFHCTSMCSDNVWYLADYDVIVIGGFYNNTFWGCIRLANMLS